MLSFFFNDTATTESYTLSLHDALPICERRGQVRLARPHPRAHGPDEVDVQAERPRRMIIPPQGRDDLADRRRRVAEDRKSTRLNSSHANISYAVFCLKKKIQRFGASSD